MPLLQTASTVSTARYMHTPMWAGLERKFETSLGNSLRWLCDHLLSAEDILRTYTQARLQQSSVAQIQPDLPLFDWTTNRISQYHQSLSVA